MRVAVLSDIHSNAHALEAVLEAVAPVDQIWVLGDTVGYGPHPDEVVSRLRGADAVAVQGNHDAAVLGRIPVGDFNELARAAVAWTAAAAAPATLAWLAEQPDRRVEGSFSLVHGSPRDPLWEYLSSVPVARRNLASFETPYCLVGHTHLPMSFRDQGGRIEALAATDGARLRLDERRCILNPGSVGQPRDGDPRACAMLLDLASSEVEWRRIEYPVGSTQQDMHRTRLPRPLADRLSVGR